MVSGGCLISGAKLLNSLLFSNVRIHSYSVLEQSVVLPNVDIGEHCFIKRAVIDKGCKIPPNTTIGQNRAEDAKRFYVSEGGIVLVTPEMLGQDTHYVR
jgi:glucose-1-phosphate adenylyltransferase